MMTKECIPKSPAEGETGKSIFPARPKVKTNAMRLLDAAKVNYETAEYEVDETDLSGVHVASLIGQDPDMVFKTLILTGSRCGYFVCCIPVAMELDLKKAALAAGDKKADLIPQKDLRSVTGYIRGGCSPIGMKKQYPIYIEETAVLFEKIAISAGVRGAQIIVNPDELCQYLQASYLPLTVE